MAIASKAPFEGGWVSLMNEHFATAADVFRLLGALPEHADQFPAADNGCKDEAGSARRLARLIGRDLASAPLADWLRLAGFFRDTLISRIADAVSSKLPESVPTRPPPLIGAGTGRFLVKAIAERLDLPYRDVVDFLPTRVGASEFSIADCPPAAAVAHLAREPRWTS
jgi:probable H4MPT-linked C1 transfer pathway protein